jgi:hypothetical protein
MGKGTLIRLNTETGDTKTYKVNMLEPEGTDKRMKPIGDDKGMTESHRKIIAKDKERLREKS